MTLTKCSVSCATLRSAPEDIDWSEQKTTNDQAAIETVLDGLLPGSNGPKILHVGIGNSSLAKRFSHRVSGITGCTISSNEKILADALLIHGYRVLLCDKYDSEFYSWVGSGFDCIVDNNLASFACCYLRYLQMMRSYTRALRVGGRILTHRDGMWWAIDGGFRLIFEDLRSLESVVPLRACQMTDDVYTLIRR